MAPFGSSAEGNDHTELVPRLAAVEPCAAQGNRLYQLRYKMQPM